MAQMVREDTPGDLFPGGHPGGGVYFPSGPSWGPPPGLSPTEQLRWWWQNPAPPNYNSSGGFNIPTGGGSGAPKFTPDPLGPDIAADGVTKGWWGEPGVGSAPGSEVVNVTGRLPWDGMGIPVPPQLSPPGPGGGGGGGEGINVPDWLERLPVDLAEFLPFVTPATLADLAGGDPGGGKFNIPDWLKWLLGGLGALGGLGDLGGGGGNGQPTFGGFEGPRPTGPPPGLGGLNYRPTQHTPNFYGWNQGSRQLGGHVDPTVSLLQSMNPPRGKR